MTIDWERIEFENPGLSVNSTPFLGEGWNSRAYLVNNELVFRFPKRPGHWEELNREITFLAYAADNLPLPVPRYVRSAPDSPAAPFGYASYRYISGDALTAEAMPASKLLLAAEAIAAFLRALHTLQPSPAVASILPQEGARAVAQDYYARSETEIMPKLPAPEANSLRCQFETYLGTPGNFSFQPAVLHADLSRDHILVNDHSIAGIIDFGDVSWGDPDYDFMYLLIECGQAFTEEVARKYGHPDLDKLGIKLLYFAVVDQISTILEGPGLAPDGQEEAAWIKLSELLQHGVWA